MVSPRGRMYCGYTRRGRGSTCSCDRYRVVLLRLALLANHIAASARFRALAHGCRVLNGIWVGLEGGCEHSPPCMSRRPPSPPFGSRRIEHQSRAVYRLPAPPKTPLDGGESEREGQHHLTKSSTKPASSPLKACNFSGCRRLH